MYFIAGNFPFNFFVYDCFKFYVEPKPQALFEPRNHANNLMASGNISRYILHIDEVDMGKRGLQ